MSNQSQKTIIIVILIFPQINELPYIIYIKNDEFYTVYGIIDVPVLIKTRLPVVSSFDYAEHRTSYYFT